MKKTLILSSDIIQVKAELDFDCSWIELLEHFIAALKALGYNPSDLEEFFNQL